VPRINASGGSNDPRRTQQQQQQQQQQPSAGARVARSIGGPSAVSGVLDQAPAASAGVETAPEVFPILEADRTALKLRTPGTAAGGLDMVLLSDELTRVRRTNSALIEKISDVEACASGLRNLLVSQQTFLLGRIEHVSSRLEELQHSVTGLARAADADSVKRSDAILSEIAQTKELLSQKADPPPSHADDDREENDMVRHLESFLTGRIRSTRFS
jgi:hypothetical protein